MSRLGKYIVYAYTRGTRAVVKDLNGRTYMSVNLKTPGKARGCARRMWWHYQTFIIRVLLTGKNKMGTRIKL